MYPFLPFIWYENEPKRTSVLIDLGGVKPLCSSVSILFSWHQFVSCGGLSFRTTSRYSRAEISDEAYRWLETYRPLRGRSLSRVSPSWRKFHFQRIYWIRLWSFQGIWAVVSSAGRQKCSWCLVISWVGTFSTLEVLPCFRLVGELHWGSCVVFRRYRSLVCVRGWIRFLQERRNAFRSGRRVDSRWFLDRWSFPCSRLSDLWKVGWRRGR